MALPKDVIVVLTDAALVAVGCSSPHSGADIVPQHYGLRIDQDSSGSSRFDVVLRRDGA